MDTKLINLRRLKETTKDLPQQRCNAPEHGSLTVEIARVAFAVHVMGPIIAGSCAFTYLGHIIVVVNIFNK
jgi:hypothetical protein